MQHNNFDRILGILCSVLDAYSAVLFLPQPPSEGKESVHTIASSFSLGDKIDLTAEIQEGRGMVGWLARNREPLLVSNFDKRKHNLGYYTGNEEANIKAFMGCALPDNRGIICVDSKRQYSFSEKDQKILHLFADLAAKMEEENRNHAEHQQVVKYYAALTTIYTLRRRYSRWTEFLRHLLDLMAAVTGFGYCALFTLDPGGESYSLEGENIELMKKKNANPPSFPVSHGVVGWVFRNGTQVVSGTGSDSSPDTPLVGRGADVPQMQSVLAMPLIIQRKTRGVLCLAHDLPLDIPEATQYFAGMAAEHLSLFLENLFVKCRLRDLHTKSMLQE
jgi:GAF domain-containing protein